MNNIFDVTGKGLKTLVQHVSKAAMALCVFLSTVPIDAAADWNVYPALRAAVDYDDNPTLTTRTDDKESILGYIIEARANATYESQTNFFGIEPVARSRVYDNALDFDSVDYFLNFRTSHTGRSNTLSLRGDISSESVRTAEVADASLDAEQDPDEIDDNDTGFIDYRERRQKVRLVPRWSYNFSDVSSILADLNYLDVNFVDRQDPVGLVDYTDIRGRLAYTRSLSARNTGVVVATARKYDSSLPDGEIEGYGLSVGLDTRLTQVSTLRTLIGYEDTVGDFVVDEPHFVADISYVRSQETTRLLAQYRRRISPSGRGTLSTRNEINLRFSRDLSEKVIAGLGTRAYESVALGVVPTSTKYIQIHAQLVWLTSASFSVQAEYRHTIIDRSVLGEGADSNELTLWVNYQPNAQNRRGFVR